VPDFVVFLLKDFGFADVRVGRGDSLKTFAEFTAPLQLLRRERLPPSVFANVFVDFSKNHQVGWIYPKNLNHFIAKTV